MCQSHFTLADGEADITQGSASHSCLLVQSDGLWD